MFHPSSRWDRRLPFGACEEAHPVDVGAVFRRGRMLPIWFDREGRRYRIREITHSWTDRDGGIVRRCFSVTVHGYGGVFYLAYEMGCLRWTLVRIVNA